MSNPPEETDNLETLKIMFEVQEKFNKDELENIRFQKETIRRVLLVFAFISTILAGNFTIYLNKFNQNVFLFVNFNLITKGFTCNFISSLFLIGGTIFYIISFMFAFIYSNLKTEKGKMAALGYTKEEIIREDFTKSSIELYKEGVLLYQKVILMNKRLKIDNDKEVKRAFILVGITLTVILITSLLLIFL